MIWTDRILEPMAPAGTAGWVRKLWLVLLLGAPLVGLAGVWAHGQMSRGRGLRVTLDRAKAAERAREVARDNGIAATGWSEYVRLSGNEEAAAYLRTHPPGRRPARKNGKGPGPPEGRPPEGRESPQRRPRFLSEATVQVMLTQPGGDGWVRVEMDPDGLLTSFRMGGKALTSGGQATDEETSQRMAEAALKEWLGDMALERLGQPEVSTTEAAGVTGARRYVWRALPMGQPETELAVTIDVAGGKVVGKRAEPSFADSFLDREVNPQRSWTETIGTLRILLIAFLSLYACYRYARRTMEKEAPHSRVILLALIYLLFTLLFTAANTDAISAQMTPQQVRPLIIVIQILATVFFSSLFGVLLGVAYGAGEGEVREGWPGKLTSLDAVLTGRIWSSNLGVSVVAGAAWAVWLFGLTKLGMMAAGERMSTEKLAALGFSFSNHPLPVLFSTLIISGLTMTVLDLLAPLTFLRRHVQNRRVQLLLLVVVAFVIGRVGNEGRVNSLSFWLESAALAAAVLAPYFLCDYLASVVAVAAYSFCVSAAALYALMPHWRSGIAEAATVAAAILVVMTLAAYKARRWDDREVRPEHARRLEERLSLQAELSAAREAQKRLLPEKPPEIEGLSIAASCTPAQEVSGDYYDFFPLSGGRLGMIVAEGGNDGLASALTIALAKGFLMHEATYGTPIEETISRLNAALGENLSREAGRTSLALFLVDPREGVLRMARSGSYPKVLVVRPDGEVKAAAARSLDTVILRREDAVLVYTDGLPRLLEQRGAGTPEQLLQRAAVEGRADSAERLHDAVLRAVLGNEKEALSDDLTAVVLRFDAAVAMEEVA